MGPNAVVNGRIAVTTALDVGWLMTPAGLSHVCSRMHWPGDDGGDAQGVPASRLKHGSEQRTMCQTLGIRVVQMRNRIQIVAGFVLLVAVVVLLGYLVFETQRIWPTRYANEFSRPDASVLIDGVDKPVAMIFSLNLGLFVLAGFALKEMPPARRTATSSIVTCILFLFGSMFSIYMGFLAKTVALYYVSFKSESAVSLTGTFIVLQILGVAVPTLAAVLLLADGFLGTRRKPDQT